jgi:hypothetical protein
VDRVIQVTGSLKVQETLLYQGRGAQSTATGECVDDGPEEACLFRHGWDQYSNQQSGVVGLYSMDIFDGDLEA